MKVCGMACFNEHMECLCGGMDALPTHMPKGCLGVALTGRQFNPQIHTAVKTQTVFLSCILQDYI